MYWFNLLIREQDNSKESVENLERLLGEFFSPSASNERKHEIETLLSSFSTQPGAWRHCIYFMMLSNNQHVSMFCLATIETVITKKWLVLLSEERSELTSMLYKQTLSQHDQVPCYIRNKLIKLVVDIARYDWPHFYPDFFSNIFALIQDPKTVLLGVGFLQIASEELICPREDLSVCRKDELKRLFTSHIPHIFNILTELLKNMKEGTDTEREAVVEASLQAICHIFSWLPLQAVNHSSLLSLVCFFTSRPDNIGVSSLSAINELLYKNFIPVSFIPSLITLCNQGYQLLQSVLQSDLSQLDDKYLSKLTELLLLCISKHWHRLEQSNMFPVNDFLSVLFQYTFAQSSVSGFYECLEIWSSFIEYLQDSYNIRYEEVIISLVQAILKKIQSEKTLDDEKTNSDDETERQEFLNHCIEIISKIADLVPTQTCTLVVDAWENSCSIYTQLLSTLELPVLTSEMTESLLYCAALTQTVGRLQRLLKSAPHICTSLAGLAITATRTGIHHKAIDRNLAQLLVNLEVQVLSALKTWLTLECIESAVESSLPLLLKSHPTHPAKLQHSAAHLLSAVTGATVKHSPLVLVAVQPLFNVNLDHLQPETQTVVQCALCRCLLLNSSTTEDDGKSLSLLCDLFVSMTPSGIKDLKQITSVLLYCQPESRSARKLLCSALMPVLEEVIKEFPLHLSDNPDICEQMLSFFLEAFRSLQDHVGAHLTQRSVETFIHAFTSVDVIQRECGIDKLLQLLVLIIEQAAPVFKQFVSSCVSLCLDHIYPAICNSPAPHIMPHLFHLLASILLHKWHYFYRATVRDREPLLQHEIQFAAILQAFGQSLTQTDITLFAQNLQALETLNHKWKLYYKDLFRTQFLAMYLMLLLNTLVMKTHALLADDIATAVYNMASVDFDTFYASFVPHFLSQTSGLDNNQREVLKGNMKAEKDLPSFIQNVQHLANDIRCYRLCNGTTPEGT